MPCLCCSVKHTAVLHHIALILCTATFTLSRICIYVSFYCHDWCNKDRLQNVSFSLRKIESLCLKCYCFIYFEAQGNCLCYTLISIVIYCLILGQISESVPYADWLLVRY